MAFLVYIFAFAVCIWLGVNAGKLKHYTLGLLTAGISPFLLVFVFNLLYQFVFSSQPEPGIHTDSASLATVLYAFLATPGAIISLVVFHMVRNQQKNSTHKKA